LIKSYDYKVRSTGIENGLTRYLKRNPSADPMHWLTHPQADHVKRLNYRAQKELGPQHFRLIGRYKNGAYRVDSRAFFRLWIEGEAKREFGDQMQRRLRSSYQGAMSVSDDIEPNLSKAAFLRSEWLQDALKSVALNGDAALPLSYDHVLEFGLSRNAYMNRYILPDAWKEVEAVTGRFVTDPQQAMADDQARKKLSALYGPAIALVLSLFFSLITLGKIAGRVWTLVNLESSRADQWLARVKYAITGGFAVVVLALPLLISQNTLARAEAIDAVISDNTSGLTAFALRWTMAVEPLIYPIGNTILPMIHFPLPFSTLSALADSNSEASDTQTPVPKVQSVDVLTPVSVEMLQRILNREGYNAGPVDGVIGQSTIDALKRFQRAYNLEPTGTQTPETITLLNADRQERVNRQRSNEDDTTTTSAGQILQSTNASPKSVDVSRFLK